MVIGLGWIGVLVVSTIVAVVLVLRPNVTIGEGRPSNALSIVLVTVGALGFLVILIELLMRRLISSFLG